MLQNRINMPVADAERILLSLAGEMKTALRSVPTKLAPKLVGMDKPIQVKRKLAEEIDRILKVLSDARIYE